MKDSGVDFLAVGVDRADVERCDIEPTLGVLVRLLENPSTVQKFRARTDLGFFGYDDDARELYEIDEVRRFVAELDKRFPFWLYFLNLQNETLALIVLCLCRHTCRSNHLTVLEGGERERFLAEHFMAVNWLFETYGLDERQNEALSVQVSDYFQKRTNPPPTQ